jgi:type I restriction enzyme S subunit
MMGQLKPYPAYKDSRVEWLGQVPEHWEVLPGRTVFREINDRRHPDEQMLSVTITRGVLRQADLLAESSKKDSSNEDKSNYKVVQPGDLVYNKMRAWQGAVGVSAYRGIVSPAYIVQRLRSAENLPRYMHFLLRTPLFASEAERWSYGITSDQWSLRAEEFKCIYFSLPPSPEQTAIVRFLDYIDRRVRRCIRAKQKLINLLEEYKQALIHQVVTGRIDIRTGQPYSAYKDSGVEWLGQVPEHWDICKLKSRLVKNDSGIWHDRYDPNGTVVLRSTEQTVSGGWRIENPARLRLSPEDRELYLLQVGDLVVTKSSGSPEHIGKTSLVTEHIASLSCAFSNFIQRLRVDHSTDPKLVWYFLNSTIGREQVVLQSTTTTGLRNLNRKILGNCVFDFPPLPEQTAIVEYLDAQTVRIDAAIAATRRQIELLREYRTRLIADVVTGKVDVREVAARLPEEPAEEEAELEGTEETAEGEAADNEAAAETISEEEVEP